MSTEAPAAPQTAGNPPAPAPSQQPAPAAAPAVAKPVLPGSKAWAEMTTEQRHAQLRGPANPRAVGHSPKRDQMEEAAARAAGEPPVSGDDPQQAPPPAGDKIKVGKFETTESDLAAMLARQSLEDLRAATRPASPEAYEAKLPADLTLPGGQTYTFNQNDPSLVAARNLAHSKGWSQGDFSEALGIFASHIAGEQAALAERSQQEITKVGANGPQRVDAVSRWITGMVGEADAKPIRATIVTDAHVRFYETIMNKLTSQGGASFSQSHRAPPDNDKIPGFDNMSFAQQRHAQEQLAARQRTGR
jgi:hypothetical protein